jgi:hypothetical protein
MANLLASEISPYLLSHKDNPVHWRAWGPAALEEADRTGKPIFLSIGFEGCWPCSVMNSESFQDPDVAALMNANFVCILVDRAERPDLDALFQAVAQALQSPGGWPLNIFLTPKAEPFASGAFFPKEDLPEQGMPGIKTAINNVLNTMRDNQAAVQQNTTNLRQGLSALWVTDRRIEGQLSPFALEQAARRVCQRLDVFSGGLNGVPKFPNVPIVDMMWRAFLRTNAVQFSNAVEVQLRQMCLSGIYDHIGGGFARFAQDEYWLIPQFEKMLNDNALLIETLTAVWQDTRLPLYKTRVEETVSWMQRDLLAPGGAFYASTSAEAGGAEGGHVVWTAAELDAVLGVEDAKIFKQVYDVREGGNWQGKSVLHRLAFPQVDPMIEGRLNGMRQKLLDARGKRPRAAADDMIYADFNGLAIRALTVAADALNRIEWQAMAVRAFWFVADKMADGGNLRHAIRDGRLLNKDFSEDYIFMALAAVALFETTGDQRYMEKAQTWFSTLNQRFWVASAGGFAQTPIDGETLFVRPRSAMDGFSPSQNGAAAKLAAQLYFHTGETHYRDRANEILSAFAQDALANVQMHASVFNALDNIIRAVQVVVIGERQSTEVAAIRDVLRRVSLPNKVVQIVSTADALPPAHPAYGKPKVQGRATVYICTATQCSTPLIDPNQIELALKTRVGAAQAVR